jgi:hypothetical protein
MSIPSSRRSDTPSKCTWGSPIEGDPPERRNVGRSSKAVAIPRLDVFEKVIGSTRYSPPGNERRVSSP